MGPLRLHTTTTISGLLFILIGVLFLAFDGTAGLTSLLGLDNTVDAQLSAQNAVARLGAAVPDVALLGAVVIVVVVVAGWRLRRHHRGRTNPAPPADGMTGEPPAVDGGTDRGAAHPDRGTAAPAPARPSSPPTAAGARDQDSEQEPTPR